MPDDNAVYELAWYCHRISSTVRPSVRSTDEFRTQLACLLSWPLHLQIFKDGELKTPHEYNGPREAAGIVSFLKKQAGPAFHSLADASAVKDFIALDDEKDVVGKQPAYVNVRDVMRGS